MSTVYKIEVAQPGKAFAEIGMFTIRGAQSYLSQRFVKGAFYAANLCAWKRMRSGREIAAFLKDLPYRSGVPISLYGVDAGRVRLLSEFRITCYMVMPEWL